MSLIQKGNSAFDHAWNQMNRTRRDTNGSVSNLTLASYWNDLVKDLPADFSVDGATLDDCSDLDRCVGVSKLSRNCICYEK